VLAVRRSLNDAGSRRMKALIGLVEELPEAGGLNTVRATAAVVRRSAVAGRSPVVSRSARRRLLAAPVAGKPPAPTPPAVGTPPVDARPPPFGTPPVFFALPVDEAPPLPAAPSIPLAGVWCAVSSLLQPPAIANAMPRAPRILQAISSRVTLLVVAHFTRLRSAPTSGCRFGFRRILSRATGGRSPSSR
jgi:hypothetical protein